MTKPVSASPPLSAGAVHDTVTVPVPSGRADTCAGPAGAWARAGVPEAAADADFPTAFAAVRVTEYVEPSASPLMVAVVAEAFDTAVLDFWPLAVAAKVYPVSGLPPSSPGAVHDTMSAPGLPNTDVISGACGT